jgi:hypothetical protein
MPFQIATPPKMATATANDSLERLTRASALFVPRSRARSLAAKGAVDSGSDLGTPYPVYTALLSKFARTSKPLASAHIVAWRYFIHREGRVVAVLELRPKGRQLSFSRLHEGPRVAGSESALDTLRKKLADSAAIIDLRFLRIAPLHLFAAWGHDETGNEEDVLVVVPPTHPPFGALVPVPQSRFVSIVRGCATKFPKRSAHDPTLPTLPQKPVSKKGR